MDGLNDNDTWQPIGLAARRLLVKLTEEKHERPADDGGRSGDDENNVSDEARYLEQRKRDIERFERMVAGYYRPRRKGKF